MPEKLLFDRLIEECRRELEGKKQPGSVQAEPEVTTIDELRKQLYEKHKKRKDIEIFLGILESSNLFLLNGAVVDDLYHLPAEYTDYESITHLPFPTMFFEFMDPIRIERVSGRGDLQGMLFGKTIDVSVQLRGADEDVIKDLYSVLLFYKDDKNSIEELYIGPDDFGNQSPEYHTITLQDKVKSVEIFNINSYTKLFDLCINIIAYINAHNVEINSVDRNKKDLCKVNRRRIKKGKAPIKPLAPYYWIEIKPCKTKGDNDSGEELILPYKERVRGHFQRYRTRDGEIRKWKEPYERGPENAPWKENRYKVLDDMQRRGNRLQNGS